MIWGYDREIYHRYGLAAPIELAAASHPHALITGGSGSGKSYALLFLLGKLLQEHPDTVVYACDFKNSEDFAFLEGYRHYYTGENCCAGIMEYYREFCQARESRAAQDRGRRLLVCDEYPALVSFLQMKDKAEKTKRADEILRAVAEILMLGRGISCGIWLLTQRADASLFASGARDNFMVVAGLGRLSKEQKGMVFPGQEVPDAAFSPGEGMLLADGREITGVKYPLIRDMAGWKGHIFDILVGSSRRQAGGEAGSTRM